jgi:hypothetical protein
MASGKTNRGRKLENDIVYRGATPPTTFYVALITNAAVPTVDTNTLGELTQIAAGNGYTTNGIAVARNTTDWDVSTEDDTNDRAIVQIKDLTWTASGGPLPASGAGAYYAVLTDDNATAANRQVFAWWDLSGPLSVSSGQPLTLQDLELRTT